MFVLLLGLLACACASEPPRQINMMPAPAAYATGTVDPFPGDSEQQLPASLDILYATFRAPAIFDAELFPYLDMRGDALRLGTTQVMIGNSLADWPETVAQSLSPTRQSDIPVTIMKTRELGQIAEGFEPGETYFEGGQAMADYINQRLAKAPQKEIFIYVPGFRITFETPVLISTELWHFQGYRNLAMAFAWPATPRLTAYFADLETAALSGQYLRMLLEFLAEKTEVEQIHLLGFSVGTRIVIDSLYQLALLGLGDDAEQFQQRFRIGEVILVGSDLDTDMFGAYMLQGLMNVPRRLTVYVSNTDRALAFSRWFLKHPRLGQTIDEAEFSEEAREFIEAHDNLVLIDVADAEKSDAGNGHNFFRRSPWVSSDILVTLAFGLDPADRGLIRRETLPIWDFPADYIQWLQTELEKLDLYESWGYE